MDVFYNRSGIGDVLLLPVKEGNRYELQEETKGDITKITSADGEVLGYNIFHASKYFQLEEENGAIPLTEAFLAAIRALFEQNGFNDPLEFDLRPKFVVGFVKSKQPHENADKLSVCQIDAGDETLQIVCGAPNIDEGQKVVVAKVGAVMPSGMKIQASELRGVSSSGMVCSQKELGLPDAPKEKGIYVLDDAYQIGEAFTF